MLWVASAACSAMFIVIISVGGCFGMSAAESHKQTDVNTTNITHLQKSLDTTLNEVRDDVKTLLRMAP